MSEVAYQRLTDRAREEGLTLTRLLERTIEIGIRKHSTHTAGDDSHHWKEIEGNPRRRRANTGTRELRLWIGSTAWRKVEAEADTTGESKSRVIDRLLRTHQWLSPEAKRRNDTYREEMRREAEMWERRREEGLTFEPATPEEVENYQRRVREFNERRERVQQEQMDRFAEAVIASRMEREG